MTERLESPPKSILRLSYEWFAGAIHSESRVPVGFVPLEFLFKEGIVKFWEGYKLHDVAVGRGKSTEYLLGKIPANVRNSVEIVASEPYVENFDSLRSCVGDGVRIVTKDAFEAIASEKNCDGISMVNAIHLVPEDQRVGLLEEGIGSLNDDGQMWASSTFIKEGIPEQEQLFFDKWMLNIFRSLSKFNENVKEIMKRVRENKLVMWPAEKYGEVFERAGFKIEAFRLETMPCTFESLRGICHYPVFTRHILPDVDPKKSAVIAIAALRKTWRDMGRGGGDISARNTLVIVGKKS